MSFGAPAAPAPMHAPAQPAAPHGQSPLIALLMAHAHASGGAQPGAQGPMPQGAGAPLPLGAGGHPAARFGHAPTNMPGC
jgi:hypothetical protein